MIHNQPWRDHNHGDCVQEAISRATALCAARNVRLTTLRRRVLEILWQSHVPLTAYAILAQLGDGARPAAPPTVYRALDFLLEQGLVHKVEHLNAYMGCPMPEHPHLAAIFLCEHCGCAAEIDSTGLAAEIEAAAAEQDFAIHRQTVEISGACSRCREQQAGTGA